MNPLIGKFGSRSIFWPGTAHPSAPSVDPSHRLEIERDRDRLSTASAICIWLALSALGWAGIGWLVTLVL